MKSSGLENRILNVHGIQVDDRANGHAEVASHALRVSTGFTFQSQLIRVTNQVQQMIADLRKETQFTLRMLVEFHRFSVTVHETIADIPEHTRRAAQTWADLWQIHETVSDVVTQFYRSVEREVRKKGSLVRLHTLPNAPEGLTFAELIEILEEGDERGHVEVEMENVWVHRGLDQILALARDTVRELDQIFVGLQALLSAEQTSLERIIVSTEDGGSVVVRPR